MAVDNSDSKEKSEQNARGKGTEVFVGGLQRSVTEDMIREVFLECGEIVEIRVMKDNSGISKGYCFVRFTTKEAAFKALKEKTGLILHGKKIGVAPSTDQDTLFLGNLKKEWTQQELETMIQQTFQDVIEVELAVPPHTGESPPERKRQNRGFAFVRFVNHSAAARAYRVASKPDFLLGGRWRPAVDWATAEQEPDPEEMSKVKIAFVGNLPSNVKEDFLRNLFEPFGKLERVAISRKSNMPVGFVHFTQRPDLEAAMKELDGKNVDGPDMGPKFKLQVSVAKPIEKSKKRNREEMQNPRASNNTSHFGGVGGQPTNFLPPKATRHGIDSYGPTSNVGGDPLQLALLSLSPGVRESLTSIFNQGLVSQNQLDQSALESLKELHEDTAMALLDRFCNLKLSEIRNKGAYLATMIFRACKESRNNGVAAKGMRSGGKMYPPSVMGDRTFLYDAPTASQLSPYDAYSNPYITGPTDPSGYDAYKPYASYGVGAGHSNLSGGPPAVSDPLLRLRAAETQQPFSSLYRAPPVAASTPGASYLTPEAPASSERRMKFDPFTGEPFKFDPYTGEPLGHSGATSSVPRLGGNYY